MFDPLVKAFKKWEQEEITTEELIVFTGEVIPDQEMREECVEHILLEDARIYI
jgi:hypothetical protein